MCRCNNRKRILALFLAMVSLFGAGVRDVQAADGVRLCAEDEHFFLYRSPGKGEVFDCRGEFLGKKTMAVSYRGYAVIEGDFTEASDTEDGVEITRIWEEEPFLKLPDGWEMAASGDENGVLAVNREQGIMELYNTDGIRFATVQEDLLRQREDCDVGCLFMDSGWLVGLRPPGEKPGSWKPDHLVIVSPEGEQRQVTAPLLLEAFADWTLSGFGDYWSVRQKGDGDENSLWTICDSDGNVVMDGIDTFAGGNDADGGQELALRKKGDSYEAYDTQLNHVLTIPDRENESVYEIGGYFVGVPYEEFGGHPCEGGIPFPVDKEPYAEVDGGILVYAEGKQLFVPLGEQEYVEKMNDRVAVVRSESDSDSDSEPDDDRLVEVGSGRVLEKLGRNVQIEIGDSFYIRREMKDNLSEVEKSEVISFSGETTYSSSASKCYVLRTACGCMYMERGVYHGVADLYGNWIVKRIAWLTE